MRSTRHPVIAATVAYESVPATGTVAAPARRVIVKVRDSFEIPYVDNAENALAESNEWLELVEHWPGLALNRVFVSLAPAELKELTLRAAILDRTRKATNFVRWYFADARSSTNLDDLASGLRALSFVETAYVSRLVVAPPASPYNPLTPLNLASFNDLFQAQGYLEPAPIGIDAEHAWFQGGGTGTNQTLADVEYGWNTGHEDLPPFPKIQMAGAGANSPDNLWLRHGTAVLGVICAVNNTEGAVGIVHDIKKVWIVPPALFVSLDPVGIYPNFHDAIATALSKLKYGNVLLLELQAEVNDGISDRVLGPVEADPLIWSVLQDAKSLNVVVVEAGGNGANNPASDAPQLAKDEHDFNLDNVVDGSGVHLFDPMVRDSGAILVSAADSPNALQELSQGGPIGPLHPPRQGAPFGARVNCFAWGDSIATCRDLTNGKYFQGTVNSGFDGTSGASSIVAGAALAVQGMVQAKYSFRLMPTTVRDILSDTTPSNSPSMLNNTPSAKGVAVDKIGVMPNLRYFTREYLPFMGFVNLRDLIPKKEPPRVRARVGPGEPGEAQLVGELLGCGSPDVALRSTKAESPNVAFGTSAGSDDSDPGSQPALRGQDNYIYLRANNVGGGPAEGVHVTVYSAPYSSLLSLASWKYVGATEFPTIPPDGSMRFAGPVAWRPSDKLEPGQYALIVIVHGGVTPVAQGEDSTTIDMVRHVLQDNYATLRIVEVA